MQQEQHVMILSCWDVSCDKLLRENRASRSFCFHTSSKDFSDIPPKLVLASRSELEKLWCGGLSDVIQRVFTDDGTLMTKLLFLEVLAYCAVMSDDSEPV